MDHDPTRRSTHQKNLQNPFSRDASRSLKGYSLHCGKGGIRRHHGGIRIREIHPPQYPSHAGPADGRTGLPQRHRYFDHQEQGCVELSSGKTRLCLSRFQPA